MTTAQQLFNTINLDDLYGVTQQILNFSAFHDDLVVSCSENKVRFIDGSALSFSDYDVCLLL